jgi:acetyl esterase/lipase
MLLAVPGAPYAVRCLPSITYGAARASSRDWEVALSLDVLLPEPRASHPVPAVVYVHGGGWQLGDKAAGMYPWHSPLMAAHGYVAVNVGYRLSWMAPHPAQLDDLKAALRWLRANADTYGIDPCRIGVWGDSAGGHLCSMLGVAEPGTVQAVVARSAPSDLSAIDLDAIDNDDVLGSLVGGPPAQHFNALRQLSPLLHVHRRMPPFLVVHGTDDEIVPFAQAQALVDVLRNQGVDVTFEVIPGGRHGLRADTDPPTNNKLWEDLGQQALGFFDRHLRAP